MRCLALLLITALLSTGAAAEPIELRHSEVLLNSREASETRVGELVFLAGFELASSDPRWGGFSSMILTRTGDRLIAISDFGNWLRLDLEHGADGRLNGLGAAEMGFLPGADGQPLDGKGAADAEGLTVGPNGGLIVSFERAPRFWLYDGAEPPFGSIPAAFPAPKAIVALPANAGVESLATLSGGDIVALAEGREGTADDIPGWLRRDARWHALSWIRTPPFRPTDAAVLPNGDLLVLERRYSLAAGPGARLSVIAADDIVPGARLLGTPIAELALPQTVDNFEGVAARAGPDGSTLIYLLSDDNRNLFQRTLLLQFRWAP